MKPEAIKMESVPSQKRCLPVSCATSEPDSCRPLSQILAHSRYISDRQNVRNVRLNRTAALRRASLRRLSSVTVACNQPASRHGDGLIGGADEV